MVLLKRGLVAIISEWLLPLQEYLTMNVATTTHYVALRTRSGQ